MASIKDVAKLAGVAPSTVSKVIHNYELVSEETKIKVNKAIDELDYIPNQVAASLSSKSKIKIAIIIFISFKKQAIDEINMQYIIAATNKAREKNIDIMTIFSTELEGKSVVEITRYLRSQSITGLIVYSLSKDDTVMLELINSNNFKMILVDADITNKTTGCVTINHYQGQYDVLDKINSLNKPKSILYLAGLKNGYVTEQRLNAARDFTNEHNIKLTVMYAGFSEKNSYKLTYDHYQNYEVIACASDLMAVGAKKALEKLDVFRPITGFDGISLMGYVAHDIWTVSQDFYKVSEVAVEQLVAIINNDKPKITLVDYEVTQIKYEDVKL